VGEEDGWVGDDVSEGTGKAGLDKERSQVGRRGEV
jgi:hypothetical protein